MNKLNYIIVAAALLCGCQQKNQSDEARIAALETGVSNLTWRLNRYRDISNTNADNYNADKRDWANITSNMLAQIETNATETETLRLALSWSLRKIDSMDVAVSNIATHLRLGADGKYYPQVNGQPTIPMDVYRRIAAEAEREWPNDYSMQQFKIKQQTTAWLRLHGQLPASDSN